MFRYNNGRIILIFLLSCFVILVNMNKKSDRVSVHFAVTFLDCWRTSSCVTTITKAADLIVNKHELVNCESSIILLKILKKLRILVLYEKDLITAIFSIKFKVICVRDARYLFIFCVIVYNLYYCCYAKTSSSAVQKRHSKVYGNPILFNSPWFL